MVLLDGWDRSGYLVMSAQKATLVQPDMRLALAASTSETNVSAGCKMHGWVTAHQWYRVLWDRVRQGWSCLSWVEPVQDVLPGCLRWLVGDKPADLCAPTELDSLPDLMTAVSPVCCLAMWQCEGGFPLGVTVLRTQLLLFASLCSSHLRVCDLRVRRIIAASISLFLWCICCYCITVSLMYLLCGMVFQWGVQLPHTTRGCLGVRILPPLCVENTIFTILQHKLLANKHKNIPAFSNI